MNVLITGGAGYIGSHSCVALVNAGHKVLIADNLCNSKAQTIKLIEQITKQKIIFYAVDVTKEEQVNTIFSNHSIDGVIHFAGLKSVDESVQNPLDYYHNNTVSTIILARACARYKVNKFIYSSSATVYGNNEVPLVETMELLPAASPYSETKIISEKILTDVSKTHRGFSVSILRYFNPIGAHESGVIGESPPGLPNNLMPNLLRVAKGKMSTLKIFGNDYPTMDGTAIRDYIHVMDVAEGHVFALEKIKEGVQIYNLGTGYGTSVLQLLNTFQKVNQIDIPYKVLGRRPGDLVESYADVNKAKRELGWVAKRDLADMCQDSWRFEKHFDE